MSAPDVRQRATPLEIGRFEIDEVRVGTQTRVDGRTLEIDLDGLAAELVADVADIVRCTVHLLEPGESARVVCVKDVVEPRVKVTGDASGNGRSHALSGVSVVTTGRIVGYQEGIIDMRGPGAELTPFSTQWLVVVEADVADSITPHAHEEALRTAGLRAAEMLGRVTADAEPHHVERHDWPGPAGSDDLPSVAYVCACISQGLLHDTYIGGRHAADVLPMVVTPQEVLDGLVVSGNCVSACDKNTTWHHQNNPLVNELLARHGRGLDLAAIVLTNLPTRLADKEASAERATELVVASGATGAIISSEGFGNPDADIMMLASRLEAAGVRTVLVTDEFAGVDGASQSLADAHPAADAVVSTGNANEQVILPPLDRTIGPVDDLSKLAGASPRSIHADGSVEVELQAIIGSTNQLGAQRLSCRER